MTIDIDGLDPTDAPIRRRDAQLMLRAITGLNIVDGDICEVVPSLDRTGITCIDTANLLFDLTCLIGRCPLRRRSLD